MDTRTGEVMPLDEISREELDSGFFTPYVTPTPQKARVPFNEKALKKLEISTKITELALQGGKPLSRNVRRRLMREVLKRKKREL